MTRPDDSHPLATMMRAAAAGRFPPVDGAVEVVPPYRAGLEAIVEFTGHAVVATALDQPTVDRFGGDGYGGVHDPAVLSQLAGPDAWYDSLDVVLATTGLGVGPGLVVRTDLDAHPRVRLARELRDDVRVYGDPGSTDGLVTISRGLGGLTEMSVEVSATARNAGYGRTLIDRALRTHPRGELVLAAVAPGNAASLRAFLASGFRPLGAVRLFRPTRRSSFFKP